MNRGSGVAQRVGVSELARLKGVRKSAISKRLARLEAEGLIATKIDGQRKTVDLAEWDRVTAATADPDRLRGRSSFRAAKSPRAVEAPVAGLTQARTETEQLRAQMARLEYERRTGQLIQRQDVTRAMETCAAAIVREIEQLPTRADDLAAAVQRGGVAGAREFLRSQVRLLREALARRMTVAAGDELDA